MLTHKKNTRSWPCFLWDIAPLLCSLLQQNSSKALPVPQAQILLFLCCEAVVKRIRSGVWTRYSAQTTLIKVTGEFHQWHFRIRIFLCLPAAFWHTHHFLLPWHTFPPLGFQDAPSLIPDVGNLCLFSFFLTNLYRGVSLLSIFSMNEVLISFSLLFFLVSILLIFALMFTFFPFLMHRVFYVLFLVS